MRRPLAISALILSLLVLDATGQPAATAPAGDADRIARRAIDMLAGDGWDKARYLAFTFNVERDGKIAASYAQRWDRFSGDYRVAGRNRDGDDVVVVMNVNSRQGRAWKNGDEVADPKEMLTFGYRRFINDTYWLLMGYKAFDPGVHREYAGEKSDGCGRNWELVRFFFDNVGLTPGDVYWMWVNRDTGLIDQWDMRLEGTKPEEETTSVLFHDYRRIGGLLLSTRREIKGKNQFIRLDDITVASEVPAGAFSGPKR